MIQVTKLGYVGLNTPDIERMIAHYTDLIGLTLLERGAGGEAYLSSTIDHHAVVFYPAATSGLRHVGLQLRRGQSLHEVAAQLREHGITSKPQTDPQAGIAELLQLADPEGNIVQLYTAIEQCDHWFQERGIVPEKLGHLATCVRDVKKIADFYQRVLGFRVSDWMGDFFVFMRCNPDHHALNFLQSDQRKMHHIAFALHDWNHVKDACDLLARHHHGLVWGPGRHGPGHNIYTYHKDPDQNVVELFAELDVMLDEDLGYFEPRPWHEDRPQHPKVWQPGPLVPNKWGILPPEDFMH